MKEYSQIQWLLILTGNIFNCKNSIILTSLFSACLTKFELQSALVIHRFGIRGFDYLTMKTVKTRITTEQTEFVDPYMQFHVYPDCTFANIKETMP
jgi:hypothetical protein